MVRTSNVLVELQVLVDKRKARQGKVHITTSELHVLDTKGDICEKSVVLFSLLV